MRWAPSFCLLLAGCSSCRKERVEPAVDASVVVDASVAPPPVVFDDAGDRGTLDLGRGITVDVHPAGPALILVEVHEANPKPHAWKRIMLERRHDGVTQADELSNPHWRLAQGFPHSAKPGETFTYRAKLEATGAWTREVTVRTADPHAPPPPPATVAVSAETPWAVDVTWTIDPRAVAGLEVDIHDDEADAADAWKLLAIVNPYESKLTHGFRLPKQTSRYRVATFNRNGMSPFVETASVTTPEKPLHPTPAKPLPVCTRLPPPSNPMDSLPDAQIQDEPELASFAGGPGGAAPRRLFGKYRGCMRDMGSFDLQGDNLTHQREGAPATEGFPVLFGIQGAGEYVGVQLGTFAFTNGRYEEVNSATFCGEVSTSEPDASSMYHPVLDGDVPRRRGPFDDCLNETPLLEQP